MAANDVNIKLKAVDDTKAAFNSVGNSLNGLKLAVMSVQAAIGSVIGGTIIKGIVDANKSYQTLEASLITFTGSAEKAAQAFDVLSNFAATTPFGLEEVVGGFNKLIARGIVPTIQQLTSFGNIAAGTGKSLDQFVEAIADASVGEFERLKEFGIKANQEGDRVKFTFGGVTTTVGKNSKEILQYLQSLGDTKFAGGMERQAKTIGGAFSALSDSIRLAAIQFGKSGFNEALVNVTNTLTLVITRLNNAEKASLSFIEALQLSAKVSAFGKEGAIKAYAEELKFLEERLNSPIGFGKEGIKGEIDSIKNKLALLRGEVVKANQELPVSPIAEQAKPMSEEVKKKLQEINDEILKLTKGEEALAVAQFSRLEGVTKGQIAKFEELFRQKQILNAQDKEIDRASQEAEQNANKAMQEKLDAIEKAKKLYEDTRTPIEAMANKMAELDRMLQLGLINWDTYGRAIMQAADGFNVIKEEGKSAFEQMRDAMRNWGADFTNVITNMVMTGKISFADLANSIIRDLIRIQVQKSITDPLIKMGTSYLDTVFRTSGTPVASPTGKAVGGSVQAGQPYLVGERGPEMFIPNQTGSIVTNDSLGGNGVVVNQTINVSTGVQQTVRAEIMGLMPQISNAAKAAVAEAKMRGGNYGKMMA